MYTIPKVDGCLHAEIEMNPRILACAVVGVPANEVELNAKLLIRYCVLSVVQKNDNKYLTRTLKETKAHGCFSNAATRNAPSVRKKFNKGGLLRQGQLLFELCVLPLSLDSTTR